MKKIALLCCILLMASFALFCTGCNGDNTDDGMILLHEKYADYFPIGAAITESRLDMNEDLMDHFNSITFEYEAKWAATEPKEGVFNFTLADTLFDYAEENGKAVRGHALCWYKALPGWVLSDNPTKETVLSRIDAHVRGVLEHYRDRAYCWDVVILL